MIVVTIVNFSITGRRLTWGVRILPSFLFRTNDRVLHRLQTFLVSGGLQNVRTRTFFSGQSDSGIRVVSRYLVRFRWRDVPFIRGFKSAMLIGRDLSAFNRCLPITSLQKFIRRLRRRFLILQTLRRSNVFVLFRTFNFHGHLFADVVRFGCPVLCFNGNQLVLFIRGGLGCMGKRGIGGRSRVTVCVMQEMKLGVATQ